MIPLDFNTIKESLIRSLSGAPLQNKKVALRELAWKKSLYRGIGLASPRRKRLTEATINQLKAGIGTRFRTKERAKVLHSFYMGVDKHGDVIFRTTSGTYPGRYWYQKIRFLDLEKAIELMSDEKPLTARQAVNLAIFGDVSVHCNDPSWKYYGWQYIATQLGYAIHPEDRYPVKRNPQCKGTVCKHLYNVLTVLPTHISLIARDMRKRGFFPVQVKAKKK
jgi:hypothetical protein